MRKNIKKLYEQRKLCNFLYFFQKHLIFFDAYGIIMDVDWRIAFSNDTLNSRGISAFSNITKRIRRMPSHIDTCCIFRKNSIRRGISARAECYEADSAYAEPHRYLLHISQNSIRRGIEVVITGLTRNQFVPKAHEGSNPSLCAKQKDTHRGVLFVWRRGQ